MVIAWVIVGGLLALAGTGIVRRYAVATSMIDHPNERSSHVVATPRGGGLAVVCAVELVAILMFATGSGSWRIAAAVVGGLIIAGVGFVDDRRGMAAGRRLFAHGIAASILLLLIPLQPLPLPSGPYNIGALGTVTAWFAVVWSINLFNFMDGTDGLAAGQAVFVFASASVLGVTSGHGAAAAALPALCATAALGFLAWNFPPARIFMGDVGSGFLGYMIAACALISSGPDGVSGWTWLILNGTFLADATVTLAVRAFHRERVYEAHRSHAYQKLAQRWKSHGRVALAFGAVNVFWLMPMASRTVTAPRNAGWIALIAMCPLIVAAILLGAGRHGNSPASGA